MMRDDLKNRLYQEKMTEKEETTTSGDLYRPPTPSEPPAYAVQDATDSILSYRPSVGGLPQDPYHAR